MSGTREWLRKLSLIAADPTGDGIELSNLRVTFDVTAWTQSAPATLNARIYNPAPATVSKLLNLNPAPVGQPATPAGSPNAAKITLKAGYDGNFGIIFRGDLIQSRYMRESPTDTYLDILAADGQMAHTWAIMNKSLAAGWTAHDVNDQLGHAYSPYGVTADDLPDSVQSNQAPRGKVMYGMARDYRYDMAKTYQMNGYYQDGKSSWLPFKEIKQDTATVVNAQTGMISMPSQQLHGVTVQMLLNPLVGPGTLMQINNKDIQRKQFDTAGGIGNIQLQSLNQQLDTTTDGLYKVLYVTHTGDTRGNEWYTVAEGLSTSSQNGRAFIPDGYKYPVTL